jgi:hypothetical protein
VVSRPGVGAFSVARKLRLLLRMPRSKVRGFVRAYWLRIAGMHGLKSSGSLQIGIRPSHPAGASNTDNSLHLLPSCVIAFPVPQDAGNRGPGIAVRTGRFEKQVIAGACEEGKARRRGRSHSAPDHEMTHNIHRINETGESGKERRNVSLGRKCVQEAVRRLRWLTVFTQSCQSSTILLSPYIGRAMRCTSCGSTNLPRFHGEIAMRFPGRETIDGPPVWAFPELDVCLSRDVAPEAELHLSGKLMRYQQPAPGSWRELL